MRSSPPAAGMINDLGLSFPFHVGNVGTNTPDRQTPMPPDKKRPPPRMRLEGSSAGLSCGERLLCCARPLLHQATLEHPEIRGESRWAWVLHSPLPLGKTCYRRHPIGCISDILTTPATSLDKKRRISGAWTHCLPPISTVSLTLARCLLNPNSWKKRSRHSQRGVTRLHPSQKGPGKSAVLLSGGSPPSGRSGQKAWAAWQCATY